MLVHEYTCPVTRSKCDSRDFQGLEAMKPLDKVNQSRSQSFVAPEGLNSVRVWLSPLRSLWIRKSES
jgi:hypothetical protein